MKKTCVGALLGFAVSLGTIHGQGDILFSNYQVQPYAPVTWMPSGSPVLDGTIQIQLFYGEGIHTDPWTLTPGVIATIDPLATFGGGGWFSGPTQVLPSWTLGDTFTFAMRASNKGIPFRWSPLWQETDAITITSDPVGVFANMPSYALIPEPTSFMLIGFAGGVCLLRCCRRKL